MPSGRVRIPAKWLRSLLKLPRGTTITNIAVIAGPPVRLELTVSHPDIVDPTSAVPLLTPDFTPGNFIGWDQ